MKLIFVFITVFVFISNSALANFDFNPNCVNAYQHILSLRLTTAKKLIAAEKKMNPANSIPYLLDNYVDFFTIMTGENKDDFERLESNKSGRINRLENEDKNSPYYLFSLAEINLQWALSRARFREFFTSALEINKAYKMLLENEKKYPAFMPNQKNLGMINALLGSLPDGLKKTMSTFGIKGDTPKGIKILESLIVNLPKSSFSFYYDEVVFLLSYVQLDIVNDSAAYGSIVRNTNKIDSSSLLKTYIKSYAGMKFGHNDDAILALNKRLRGSEYQPYPYLDYLSGVAKLRSLDQGAVGSLNLFLKNYNGTNLQKDTYLNLAYLSLLNGKVADYHAGIQQVKSKGYTYHDRDQQAVKEAGYPIPDIALLKARLLFDGGYFDAALKELSEKKIEDFKILRDKIEYCYRLGRIYDAKEKNDVAIKFYQFAINLGKKEPYYFAANAALRIGNIFEAKKDSSQAKLYYNTAISMKDHDYETSVENKAKAGLKRLR